MHHAWLIEPVGRVLEVLRLDEGQWKIVGVHTDNDVVRAEPFQDVELRMNDLWLD